jgi:hypothetical protein
VKYRHELKHEITTADMITIRQRLRTVAEPDRHAVDGKYLIPPEVAISPAISAE